MIKVMPQLYQSVYPEVDVRLQVSFAAAVTAIGATPTTLIVSDDQAVAADITVPATLTLRFTQGGSLSIADTKTVTIHGHVEAGLYQIFKWTGTGKVVFGIGAVKEVYPQWWGAVADNIHDDTSAIQAAINSLPVAGHDAPPWGGGVVFFSPGQYRVSSAITVISDRIHLRGGGAGWGTELWGYGAINILELGNGTQAIFHGSLQDILVIIGDGAVLRGIYQRSVHLYNFYNVLVYGGSIAGIEVLDSWVQHYYGGGAISCSGKGIFLNHSASWCNEIQFFGTSVRNNTGIGLDDAGGSGRRYEIYAENNAGGGLHATGVLGFSATAGYFEGNLGYDVKIDTGSSGGVVSGGYLTNVFENSHKFIWLNGCKNVSVGPFYAGGHGAFTGNVGVYVDAGTSGITINPFTFFLDTGATGTKVDGPNHETSSVVYNAENGRIILGPDNAHGWAAPYQIVTGHVQFASTGTWRTVAVITFAAADYGGGYLEFSYGGIQQGVGGAKAVLIGTFDKTGGTITFTSISNVVTNCTIQAVADGATYLVIQMKSSSGANTLDGNFSFVVMGSANVGMTVTAPGYSD